MQLLFGYTPGARPPSGIPLLDADPFDMLVLTACGIAGFVAARLARLPAAAIPGPMLFSAVLHIYGVTDAQPTPELVNDAQRQAERRVGERRVRSCYIEWSHSNK